MCLFIVEIHVLQEKFSAEYALNRLIVKFNYIIKYILQFFIDSSHPSAFFGNQ